MKKSCPYVFRKKKSDTLILCGLQGRKVKKKRFICQTQEKQFDAKRAATRRTLIPFLSLPSPRVKAKDEKEETEQQEYERSISLSIHKCLESLFAKQALTLSFVSGFLTCMGRSYHQMHEKQIKAQTVFTFMTLDIYSASYLANPQNEICLLEYDFILNKFLEHKTHRAAYEKYHRYFDEEERSSELIDLKKFLLNIIDEQLEQLEVFFEDEMILMLGELFFQLGQQFQAGEVYRLKLGDKPLPNSELALIFYQTASELGHVEAKNFLSTMNAEIAANSRLSRNIII